MPNTIPRDSHAMIIGAMKCGTSSLYDYLCGHPEICPSITKEPEFFSENQGHGVDVATYSDLFSFNNSIHKYTLDGSTGYTKYPTEMNVSKNIFDYGISPKLIYIIRNPFDRITSHFNFMQRDDEWKLDIVDNHLISTCNYFLQLEQYKRYFPINDILILDFDDLKNDPSSLLKNIYDFLGLSHNYFPDSYEVKNRTRAISKIEAYVKKLGIDHLFRHLPKTPKKIIKYSLQKIFSAEQRKLTGAERELVHKQLKEGMLCLNEIYGFDTSKWGFN